MYRATTLALSLSLLALVPASPVAAQTPDIQAELRGHFEASARKLVALSEAMPADAYGWRPMEGVASVGEVYMHIARYNYMYPEQSLGIASPMGADEYGSWEGEVTRKDEATRILARSMDHVRSVMDGMSAEDAAAATRLYGRDVAGWAVLLQLVAHMNEHLGQSIAYARMNGVAPPWSR